MKANGKTFIDIYDFSVIRQLRKSRDLTIKDVSEASGISPAVISRLERNQAQAELETLFRLARVFGLSSTDLVSLAERRTSHAKSAFRYESGGFNFESVQYANVKCFHGRARKGHVISHPEMHRDSYELCWVLRGRISIALPSEKHVLEAGDALQFDAILEHSYEALDNLEIIILHISKGKRF